MFKSIISEKFLTFFIDINLKNFESTYFIDKYNNELISTGLKIKPVDISKLIYKNFINDILTNFRYNENVLRNEDINKELDIIIKNKNNICEKKNLSEMIKYISYCFYQLKFCSYYEYCQTFKRKIFQHYGENTIHNYSYLKKSKIKDHNFQPRNFDNEKSEKFFAENKKLYWIAIYSVPESFINDHDILSSLLHKLKKLGLRDKGWEFLKKQSDSYIIRFCQNTLSGIFCVNFQLRDAWLRNFKLKQLLNEVNKSIRENKSLSKEIYIYLGKLCKDWKKPISKFEYFNISFLEKMNYFTKKDLFHAKKNILEKGYMNFSWKEDTYQYEYIFMELSKSKSMSRYCVDIISKKLLFFNVIELYNKRKGYNNINSETVNEIEQSFHKYGDIYYNIHFNKNHEIFKYYYTYIKSLIKDIDTINKYQIFEKIKEYNLYSRSIIYLNEFVNVETLDRIKVENKDLFDYFITILPFTGLNYIKDIKNFLKDKGLSDKGWKLLLKNTSEYINLFLNNTFNIEDIISFLNKEINIANVVPFIFFKKEVMNTREDRVHNKNIFFNIIFKKLSENIFYKKVEEVLLDIMPKSQIVLYEKTVERLNVRDGSHRYSLASLVIRDYYQIIDYLNSTNNLTLNHKSVSGILEASKEWHINELYGNLCYHNFKNPKISDVVIDREFHFKYIHNTDLLQKESKEMKHCVATYNEKCFNEGYLVYHVDIKEKNGIENKATLGVELVDGVYIYQQMYGEYNNLVTKKEESAAKYLVDLLNQ